MPYILMVSSAPNVSPSGSNLTLDSATFGETVIANGVGLNVSVLTILGNLTLSPGANLGLDTFNTTITGTAGVGIRWRKYR